MGNPATLFDTSHPSVEQVYELVDYVFDQDSRALHEVNLTVVPALGGLMVAHLDEQGSVLTSIGKAPSGAIAFARHQVLQRSVHMWGEDDGCAANGCVAYSLQKGHFEADNALAKLVFAYCGETDQRLILPVALTHLIPAALGHPESDALSAYSFVDEGRLTPFDGHIFSLPLRRALKQTQHRRIAAGRAPLWVKSSDITQAA